ncbi:MAG: YfiT family bacillithiol transferase [Gemmatimonadaceae bacterium]
MADLRYPIGKADIRRDVSGAQRAEWIEDIANTPAALRDAVQGLTPDQLATPYRPGGWTVQQVVHHLPDSHLNAYTRFKLALTEDEPTIKPYDEAKWAELPDSVDTPVDVSLTLLDALHARWVTLLRSLGPTELKRGFRHPEHGRVLTLEETLSLYSWHGRHHVAHITALREREGWR